MSSRCARLGRTSRAISVDDITQVPFGTPERLVLTSECLRQYLRVRRMLRRRPLPDVLIELREGLAAPANKRPLPVAPHRLAFIVVRVISFLPTDTRCLMRSLTLLAMLTRRGRDAVLVIGVTSTEAFGAHAWLELDGVPLLRPGSANERLVEL